MNNQKKKPMSYLGMECVLGRMDFNVRQSVTKRCPSLQVMDEKLPLKINTLTVGTTEVKINDTTYQMGIIQQYNNHKTPKHIGEINARGGCQQDVDRFGFCLPDPPERPRRRRVVGEGPYSRHRFMDSNRPEIEARKRVLEEEQRRIENRKTNNNKQIMAQRMDRLVMERRIDEVNSQILPFIIKQNNLKPHFKHYLQLRITSDNHAKQKLEKMENRKTLSESTSDLLDYLLPKRKIFINNFVILDLIDVPAMKRILKNDDGNLAIRKVSLDLMMDHFEIDQSMELETVLGIKHPLVSLKHHAIDVRDLIHMVRHGPDDLMIEAHLVLEAFDKEDADWLIETFKEMPGAVAGSALDVENPLENPEYVRIPRSGGQFEIKVYLKKSPVENHPFRNRENNNFDFHIEFNKIPQ